MSRRLLAILALLAVAFAILTGLAVKSGILGPPQQSAVAGGPFQMTDQSGRTVDQGVLKGKWSAVFFGFTQCPDACPTTLFALGQTQKLLADKANAFQTVFISVDPGRDTPKQMATYLSNDAFPKGTVGLTGTPAQVDTVAKAYHVFYQKAGEGPDYTVNHSTMTYLMDKKGRFACLIPYGETPEQMAVQIARVMKDGPKGTTC
jgi:protein SCO1/2